MDNNLKFFYPTLAEHARRRELATVLGPIYAPVWACGPYGCGTETTQPEKWFSVRLVIMGATLEGGTTEFAGAYCSQNCAYEGIRHWANITEIARLEALEAADEANTGEPSPCRS